MNTEYKRRMTAAGARGLRATYKETEGSMNIRENRSDSSFEDNLMDGSLISNQKLEFNDYCKRMGMREYDNGTVIFYEDEYDNNDKANQSASHGTD